MSKPYHKTNIVSCASAKVTIIIMEFVHRLTNNLRCSEVDGIRRSRTLFDPLLKPSLIQVDILIFKNQVPQNIP